MQQHDKAKINFQHKLSFIGLTQEEMTLHNYLPVRIAAPGFAKKWSNLDNQNLLPKNPSANDNTVLRKCSSSS